MAIASNSDPIKTAPTMINGKKIDNSNLYLALSKGTPFILIFDDFT